MGWLRFHDQHELHSIRQMMTMNSKHSRFFMCPPSRYMPNGQPVRNNQFYVRFYGPRTGFGEWYQASHLVKDYKQAIASFHEWVAETEKYINMQIKWKYKQENFVMVDPRLEEFWKDHIKESRQ